MAPRQRFPPDTVDEPPPIMATASSSSNSSPTSAGTAPLLAVDSEDSPPQSLRPSRESSFSDSSDEVSLTPSCSIKPPLKNVVAAYPTATAPAAVTDEASEIAREQHDFFNLIALVSRACIEKTFRVHKTAQNKKSDRHQCLSSTRR
jgi:hypothetical protein